MVDLQPVHRYAAGALMSLALHQAHINQLSLINNRNDSIIKEESSLNSEFDEENLLSWASPQSGLLRPIFRYLQIDNKAWIGLEQTALSTDAKSHIGAFLRILSDEETACNSSEVNLAETIETTTLKFEGSLSDSNEEEHTSTYSEVVNESKIRGSPDVASSSLSGGSIQVFHRYSGSMVTERTMPLLKEDYFACPSAEQSEAVPDTDQSQKEHDGMQRLRDVQVFSLEDNDGTWASDLGLLKQGRKVAALYELLSAAVADTPEEGEDVARSRRGYDARQRVALRLLATWLDVNWDKMAAMEILVAYATIVAQEDKEEDKEGKAAESSNWAKWKRSGLIGAAAVTGGALLALTGGLAAPAIAAGLSALAPTLGTIIPAIGSTGFAAAAAAAGSVVGSVAVAASFGAAGAGLTGFKMARRTGGIEEFGFEGLGENHQRGRLAVGIVVSGFLNNSDDFTKPWQGYGNDLEMYAVRWETKNLLALSTAIQDWLTSSISNELMKQGAMLTVLSTLLSALAWPSTLLSLTSLIDTKWAVAVDRSRKAGKLLADVLTSGLQGNRPVTLIGFSLGARVIFKCLEKLAKRGENGRIVERVVLLGAPISTDPDRWKTVRKVVAGRFINVYSTNDWLLAIVYRASLLSQGLAGIQSVNVPGIENVDVTDMINGHSLYMSNVLRILEALNLDSYFPAQI